MQFSHQKGNFSTLNLLFAYFVRSEMSKKGIIMSLGMNNTRQERKILIILDFENRFLPTYLPLCRMQFDLKSLRCERPLHLELAKLCGKRQNFLSEARGANTITTAGSGESSSKVGTRLDTKPSPSLLIGQFQN